MNSKKQILLIALGGNAMIRSGQSGSIHEQFDNLRIPMRQIARLSRHYRILITHGNGPQVGNLLLQQETCESVPRLPLEILVAQTQGQIGYMIESTLDSELMAQDDAEQKFLVNLNSYVVVDENDPAFQTPSKPIGPILSPERIKDLPYPVIETPKGYRRVVASPQPVTIVEKREIAALVDMDFIVICCGGGGIPVIRRERSFCGVNAVIDKDLASSLLAREIGAQIMIIATDVEGVALHFGQSDQRFLRRMTLQQAEHSIAEEQLAIGSMQPKLQAAAEFIQNGGTQAVITSMEMIEDAVEGKAGTEIVKSG
ncbi:MAG: carbamate kinase [candidate division KSB1 bacterium]|nr:carbamate kinase [candidate division KSB1 bacterium]